ncbi:MAG: hypothetical protein PF549_01310, partial [Patescibacteria group bacterium]|nr:hypothetical protein [Patescibacteria group bacterium]
SQLDALLYQDNFLLISTLDEILIQDSYNSENVFLVNSKRDRNFNIDKTRKNKVDDFLRILNNENIKSETLVKIKDSLRYYRFYLYENNINSALLNLWIALESLFSNDEKDGNFDLIKSVIPSVTSMYYSREVFDELQLYILKRIEQEKDNSIKNGVYLKLKEYVENNNIYKKRKQFNGVGLLRILSDLDKRDYFINQLNDPYCSHKYGVLSGKFVVEKNHFKEVQRFIKINYSMTQWDLYEIYRIRNSIVHGGKNSNKAREAVYSLEYFYVLLLDDILEKLNANDFKGVFSLTEYFSRSKRSYRNYTDLIGLTLNDSEYRFLVLPYFVL